MADVGKPSSFQRNQNKGSLTSKGEVIQPPSINELKNAMYASCASHTQGKTFDQNELLALGTIPNQDINILHQCTSGLTNEGLFKLMRKDGRVCWKVVKKETAARYQFLTPDEALVFSYVESAGQEGIWLQAIRLRAGLHGSVITKCLKSLVSKQYIKQIFTIKFPKRRTYFLYDINPPESVTGGPFYDKENAEIDVDFVQVLAQWAERYIIARSWYFPSSQASAKRKEKDNRAQAGRDRSGNMLPMPPGYNGYPTIAEMTRDLNKYGLSNTILKEAEIQQLVDTLCWDGRVEKAWSGKGYKAIRQLDPAGSDNGFTEPPCGRCPNFAICHDDGPINTRSCEYFQDWLATSTAGS